MDRHDLSHLPTWYRRVRQSEDATLAFWFGWFVAPPILALGGFYLGTIIGPRHVRDLVPSDVVNYGYPGAALGFLLGLIIALFLWFVYPAHKEREDAFEESLYHGKHDHHDEIGDEMGQAPEHEDRPSL